MVVRRTLLLTAILAVVSQSSSDGTRAEEPAALPTYIVVLEEASVPLYLAGVSGSAGRRSGFDADAPESLGRARYLRRQQRELLERIEVEAGPCELVRGFQHALNGMVVRMSERTARAVSGIQGVRFVEPNHELRPATQDTPILIGAPAIWNGSAIGAAARGEGMIIGILDSGINAEHPSFADVGDDGYDHTNPRGVENYLGLCLDPLFAPLCNDKLIGLYSFTQNPDPLLLPGQNPALDTNGHGSHVAGTAAGNVLFNVPLTDAKGTPTGIEFSPISGVAPRANIIAYKVCAPGCFPADIATAVDQAIQDGVDVINHSIGSPDGSPWASSQAMAFLAAREAGIFVSASAGQSGPAPGSAATANNAPWVAAVAATTHARVFPDKLLQDLSGGDQPPPGDIPGRGLGAGYTGPIVYAGDFPTQNGSRNDAHPQQCLDPFPVGTFNGEIVVCERGTIARIAKSFNVQEGGALGMVLANVSGGETDVIGDAHVLPGIHIDDASGDALKAWLASGEGHSGTISAVHSFSFDPTAADKVADFSSRGPHTGFNFMAPSMAAPGVAIVAAGADLTAGQLATIHQLYPADFQETVPGSFGVISGTSMSSPHIAGAAALFKQLHPDWTSSEIMSALMSTAKTGDIFKADGTTLGDPFDFGGGRVQLDQAVSAGLVLDETVANFDAADPDRRGDPSTLNVGAVVSNQCLSSCSWQRTVRATVDGAWTVSTAHPWLSVEPPQFALIANAEQTLEITASPAGQPLNTWVFSSVLLAPGNGNELRLLNASVPTQHIPAAVFVPEPGSLTLLGAGIAGLGALWTLRRLQSERRDRGV